MKIAIVKRKSSFSDRWIPYCESHNIDFKIVDPYRNDIIQQVADCDAFMWHFHQADYRDMQMAVAVLTSVQKSGKKVYPNPDTCWHFDNKVAEKYLLEAVGAPLVPSFVFYTECEAMEWVNNNSFPKVFKLKGGAGASNVKLAHNREEAVSFVKQAFGKGFSQYDWKGHFKEQYRKYKLGKATLRDLIRPLYYEIKRYPTVFSHYHQKEIGYIYFQEFIPNNDHDTRIVVVNGEYAMGETRFCREGDFRASGSGDFSYGNIDTKLVSIAFEFAKKLNMQSIAFDFIEHDEMPLIVEISYGFGTHGIEHSGGYWTTDLVWHDNETLDLGGWMVEGLIKDLKR